MLPWIRHGLVALVLDPHFFAVSHPTDTPLIHQHLPQRNCHFGGQIPHVENTHTQKKKTNIRLLII